MDECYFLLLIGQFSLYSRALGISFQQKMLRNIQHFAHYLQDARVERYNLN
jgi:hypothetical protein